MAMVVCISLGTPPSAGPDEPAHMARSAALVRGDLFGSASSAGPAFRSVTIPAWSAGPDPTCFAFEPEQPASCVDPRESGTVLTTAASYPVWGHLLPGIGTVIGGERGSVWAARILGAVPSTILLAAAVTAALRARRERLAAALLLAMTPTTVFLIAVVNPSGLTVAGALAVWTAAIVEDSITVGNRLLFVAGAAALILPRSDGLLWGCLVGILILYVRSQSPRSFLQAFRPVERAAMGLITTMAVSWSVLVRPELIEQPIDQSGIALAQQILGGTGSYLREAVGVLGWLDTPVPEPALFLWILAVGLLAGHALERDRRATVAAVLAALGFFAAGWGLELVQAGDAGLFWQGRYGLPLLVGAVLLVAGKGQSDGPDVVARGIAGAVWFIWNASVFQSFRRFGIGASDSILPWKWDGDVAAVSPIPLLMIHGLVSGGLCAFVVRSRYSPTTSGAS